MHILTKAFLSTKRVLPTLNKRSPKRAARMIKLLRMVVTTTRRKVTNRRTALTTIDTTFSTRLLLLAPINRSLSAHWWRLPHCPSP